MDLLDHLNPQQREAVQAIEGPVLVLAGAGSGKTRVITYRVAHLLAQGAPAEGLLAVTFTNKAAEQMRERVQRLVAEQDAAAAWISTFHSFCARLLRREAPRLGLRRDFPIYDEEDQLAAVRLALEKIQQDAKSNPPRSLLSLISHAKNHGIRPGQMREEARAARNPAGVVAADAFEAYEAILRQAGALDFDDLLLRAVELLSQHADCRERWSRRFRFIQVDEYQDTNRAQYDLVRLLAGAHGNLCVVGDEDQSIYSWRGADVSNILRFAEDFPGTKVVRLEQNYRSTQNILDAAGGVVAKNTRRLGKRLVATRGAGSNLRYFEARDAAGEAEYVSEELFRLLREDPGCHIAVLYRTNFQSRAFEEALRRMSIRYRLVGGFSFYQRAEVKDVLAYARLALHPEDDVALLRVLNTPPRGIGARTVELLRRRAQAAGTSLWAAIGEMLESGDRPVAALRGFRELIAEFQQRREQEAPADFLRLVVERSGYAEYVAQQDLAEHTTRQENLHELINAAAEAGERGESFEDFLDRAALVSDADDYDERAPVSLMTLHSAKGLEFDHVFLVGMEDGLFPHSRSLNGPEEIEEERRLCYVGMTRARETLTLTRAVYRRRYGNDLLESSPPSRFLAEIPGELIDTAYGSLAGAGDARRYEDDPEYLARTSFPKPRRFPEGMSGRAAARSRSPRSGRTRDGSAARGGSGNPLIGMRVRHPSYGLGTIIGVDGEGEERKLTVSFEDYGTKKLLERYAHLERA
jgi:DNA helicase-2/ATP-dependent DNA helicase PcrA